ncbi:hypothetical protein OSB04_021551, partial [Centaurea solstitialis]
MASNINHFKPKCTTSNGSMSLDPSRKAELMQFMRQNQHLMQLLLRRQVMQQPMSWTMGIHSPQSSTTGNFWIFDSGCFNHMSPYPAGFITKQPSQHPTVRTADLTPKPVLFSGNFSNDTIQLPDVLHAGVDNLLARDDDLLAGDEINGVKEKKDGSDPKTKQILGKGRRVGRVLEVVYLRLPLSSSYTNLTASVSKSPSLDLWHARLGHLSSSRVQLLANSGLLGNITSNVVSCLSCKLGKHHALPFELNDYKSASAFDLIHSDVWGPAPHPSMGGCRYFVIFVDDHTRFTWIYLMKHRSELPQIYITFSRMIQTQFSKPIKILRADNAMEYKESSLIAFLRSQGTISQYSCPGTSPQNGRAERKHRHILDTIRTLLISAKCPEHFWGEAAFTAVYTINRHATPTLQNKSPYETLHGITPAYELLKVWGCACFVQLQPHEHTKLQPRSRLCLFLGYGIEHKGYHCWDPISKRLRISRNVTFWEHDPFYTMPNSHFETHTSIFPFFTDSSISLDLPSSTFTLNPEAHAPVASPAPSIPPPVPIASPTPEAPVHVPIPPPTQSSVPTSRSTSEPSVESADPRPSSSENVRRSDRVRQVPFHLRDYHCYATLLSNHEPTSYKEASSSSHWQAAMQEELQALDKAQTWDSVPLPPGKRPIGSKWVFKIKTKSDGSIDRYKARLVAKGFNQEYGIDYEETFAPVARITSVRNLLAIAATKRWPLFQMDVKNAFLNGDLSEEVFMNPPSGVSLPTGHVCRLRKALYGLKQAPRAWFEKFSTTVLSLGFSASNYDSGLFTCTTDAGTILLLLYVDDMIITGSDSTGITLLKQSLSASFEMKDLGKLHYFLGLEVLSDSRGTYLCQAKYTSDPLSRAGITDQKVVSTPLESNLHLTPNAGPPLKDPTLYRQLVGSLVYLTVTRPDIAYAVHIVSQFMSAPCSDHYAAVLRILRYLKGTMFHGLYFSSTSSLILRGFSDADWDSDMTDRRSTTGFCFFLGDSLISCRSKKQSLTARSSTEAEYRALADTSQELIWLRSLLSDMGAPQLSPTLLWCDNTSAIQIAHNDVFHERTKHIEIDCHFVRQHVVRKTIQLQSISTDDQPADIFTKAHLPGRFRELGLTRKLKSLSKDIDEMLELLIKEKEDGNVSMLQRCDQTSFIDILLSLRNEYSNTHDNLLASIDRLTMKAVLLDMLAGGIDTSKSSIEWILSALIKHPRVMKKLREEIKTVVGDKQMVEETDLAKLSYLHMVIKEGLRLYPVGPLLVPHESIEDIVINGYNIPKKTLVLINIWAIGRDPKVWSENWPEFRPERFLEREIDFRGPEFQLMTFGIGRRGCPGMNLGLLNIGLVVSNLVHCFDWILPNGMSPDDLDMNEKFGLNMPKIEPLLAIPTYRMATLTITHPGSSSQAPQPGSSSKAPQPDYQPFPNPFVNPQFPPPDWGTLYQPQYVPNFGALQDDGPEHEEEIFPSDEGKLSPTTQMEENIKFYTAPHGHLRGKRFHDAMKRKTEIKAKYG